jgi:sugar lactone lactonase YvrE
VHVIFWGSNWNSSGSAARAQILKMFEGLSGSHYQEILNQYFDPTGRISSTVQVDSYTDTSVSAPSNVGGSSIEQEVASVIGAGKPWPKRELNAQFAVLTAPGTTYEAGFTGFCAYHSVDSQGGIYLAVPWAGDAPFGTENGCQSYYGGGDATKATSLMASHEYAEAATDPRWNTEPGWLDSEGYEISDMCSTPYDELPNGTFVQGQYDDHQSACSISDKEPPLVLGLTETATNVTEHGARLNATINPESLATSYHFEYGTTTSYGTSIPAENISVGSGRSNVQVEEAISGLELEHVYHYRVAATNSSGTTYGEDRTFYTSKWRMRQAPPRGPEWNQDTLEAVSCTAPETCMAVGGYYDLSYGANNEEVNRILSYQLSGGKWVQRLVPEPPGDQYPGFTDVSCSAADACTAVGYAWNVAGARYAPIIDRWNGKEWLVQEVPSPVNSVEALLDGVSCLSATECIAVGSMQSSPGKWENLSMQWQGSSWKVLTTPTASDYTFGRIDDISCSSSSYCVAVGWHNPASGGAARPDILAWNGSKWSLETPSQTYAALSGVSCASATFCLALDIHGAIEVWDGSKWSSQTLASTPDLEWSAFEAVSCSSATNCTLVGYGGSKLNGRAVTLAETWNGTSWSERTTPRENERISNKLTGVSCIGSASCAAVGFSKASGQYRSLMETREMPVTPIFSTSFGSGGTGNGQFNFPRGIAVDAKGNIWVADGANNRVQKFNAKGEYVSKFGSLGSGNGQFSTPVDVAIDSSGNLWVTDAGNARVEEFNAKGEYLNKFGTYGTEPGTFVEPTGIAIDGSGNMWITDHRYARMEEFNSKREYVRTVTELGWPAGVAIDSEGHVWVADQGSNHVFEYSSTGQYISQLGSYGFSEGRFAEPSVLDFKANGDLLVIDAAGGRLQEFSPTGEYLTQFGGLWYPDGIAVAPGGVIYASSSQRNRIERWAQTPMAITREAESVGATKSTLAGIVNAGGLSTTYHFEYVTDATFKSSGYASATSVPVPSQSVGSGTEEVQVSNTLESLTPETSYHFRLVAGNESSTTYGMDLTFTTGSITPTYSSSFGTEGTGNGQFKHPADAAVDSKGNVWVVDKANNRIQKFNEKGEYQSKFGTTGSGNGQLSGPAALALDSKGNIWVADTANNRIEKFNEKGEYLSNFGSFGTGNGQFNGPEGIAIDPKGNLWVSDTYNGRVQKFNESGEFLKVVGSKGSGAGQFGEPTGIDVGTNGNVWIADWLNNRVAEFNESGEFVRQFGSSGTGNGQFNRPDAISADNRGHVWVGDQNNCRIEGFNESGSYLTQFGSKGSGSGQFIFSYPMGIVTDSKGNFWITDTNNNRVEKWVGAP